MSDNRPIIIATRGSALALAQSNLILGQCRQAFPELQFELKIIKTTGDKLQTASMKDEGKNLPKGLFTKELEVAMLEGTADLAVHSLKDLPTELPDGLMLGATGVREDVRDILVYRDARHTKLRGFEAGMTIAKFPPGSVISTSSTRRKAQLLVANPKLSVPEIRGNVPTRLEKIASRAELDATVLAMAGLSRLKYAFAPEGQLEGNGVAGLLAIKLELDEMLPAPGQGAIGIEIRQDDQRLMEICSRLDHVPTHQCVTAERAFLAGLGGGCQSPVAAHAVIRENELRLQGVTFLHGPARKGSKTGSPMQAQQLGEALAKELMSASQ